MAGADLGGRRRGGVGRILARQLLAAGERVLDVPPELAARVRLLPTRDISKNDPSDARSVAVAALRSAQVREGRRDDHAAVLKVWSKRYEDLGRARTQVACQLHLVLCELIPGGMSKEITAGQAIRSWKQQLRPARWRRPAGSSPPSSPMTCPAARAGVHHRDPARRPVVDHSEHHRLAPPRHPPGELRSKIIRSCLEAQAWHVRGEGIPARRTARG